MRPTVVRVPPYSVMADAPGGLCCHPCSSLLCRDHLIPDLPRIALFKVLETRNGQSVGYSNESQIYFISLHNISICASVSVWGFERYSSSSGFVYSCPPSLTSASVGAAHEAATVGWSRCNDLWIYASLKWIYKYTHLSNGAMISGYTARPSNWQICEKMQIYTI